MDIKNYIQNRVEELAELNRQSLDCITTLKINSALKELVLLLEYIESEEN